MCSDSGCLMCFFLASFQSVAAALGTVRSASNGGVGDVACKQPTPIIRVEVVALVDIQPFD